MDYLALGGGHGLEGDAHRLPRDLLRGAVGERRKSGGPAIAIALRVDDDLAALAAAAVDDDRGDVLQGVDGGPVAPDEQPEVVAADIGALPLGVSLAPRGPRCP